MEEINLKEMVRKGWDKITKEECNRLAKSTFDFCNYIDSRLEKMDSREINFTIEVLDWVITELNEAFIRITTYARGVNHYDE